MTKISQNHMSAVNGGANCFLIGVSMGISILTGNILLVAAAGINAYNFGCL